MVNKLVLNIIALASWTALSQSAFGFTQNFCEAQKEKFDLGCYYSLQSCIKASSSVEACVSSAATCHAAAATSYKKCMSAAVK